MGEGFWAAWLATKPEWVPDLALSLTLPCDLRSSLHPSLSLLSSTLGPLGHCSLGPLDADVFQAEGTSSRAMRACVESWGFWPTESELLMMVPKQNEGLGQHHVEGGGQCPGYTTPQSQSTKDWGLR